MEYGNGDKGEGQLGVSWEGSESGHGLRADCLPGILIVGVHSARTGDLGADMALGGAGASAKVVEQDIVTRMAGVVRGWLCGH